jgi:hypothetical protein
MNQGWLSLRFTTYLPTLPTGRQALYGYRRTSEQLKGEGD